MRLKLFISGLCFLVVSNTSIFCKNNDYSSACLKKSIIASNSSDTNILKSCLDELNALPNRDHSIQWEIKAIEAKLKTMRLKLAHQKKDSITTFRIITELGFNSKPSTLRSSLIKILSPTNDVLTIIEMRQLISNYASIMETLLKNKLLSESVYLRATCLNSNLGIINARVKSMLDSISFNLYNNYTDSLLRINYYNRAILFCNAATVLKPIHHDIWIKQCSINNELSNYAEVLKTAAKAIPQTKNTENISNLYFESARAYQGLKDNELACLHYSKVINGKWVKVAEFQRKNLKCKTE